jgi:hypothetical protein
MATEDNVPEGYGGVRAGRRDPGETFRTRPGSSSRRGRARTDGGGPALAATPSEEPPHPDSPPPASASLRSGRALLATGTALAVLGVTLTGSIGAAADSVPRSETLRTATSHADGRG